MSERETYDDADVVGTPCRWCGTITEDGKAFVHNVAHPDRKRAACSDECAASLISYAATIGHRYERAPDVCRACGISPSGVVEVVAAHAEEPAAWCYSTEHYEERDGDYVLSWDGVALHRARIGTFQIDPETCHVVAVGRYHSLGVLVGWWRPQQPPAIPQQLPAHAKFGEP